MTNQMHLSVPSCSVTLVKSPWKTFLFGHFIKVLIVYFDTHFCCLYFLKVPVLSRGQPLLKMEQRLPLGLPLHVCFSFCSHLYYASTALCCVPKSWRKSWFNLIALHCYYREPLLDVLTNPTRKKEQELPSKGWIGELHSAAQTPLTNPI